MKLQFSVFLLSVLVREALSVGQKGVLYCYKHDDEYEAEFVLYKNDDVINRVFAVDFVGNAMTSCSSEGTGLITGNGEDANPFILRTVWYYNGTTIGSDCGRYHIPGTEKFIWYVEARRSDISPDYGIQLNGDRNYELVCDISRSTGELRANGTVKTLAQKRITIVNATQDNVLFYTTDESDQSVNSIVLGDYLKLVLKLKDTAKSNGLYATRCRSCSSSECKLGDIIYPITDKDGCLVDQQHVGGGKSPFFTSPSPDVKISIRFESFRFNILQGNVLHFFCNVRYCFKPNDDRCSHENECHTRSRRTAEEDEEDEVQTYVIINDRQPQTAANKEERDNDKGQCRSDAVFMSLTIVMSVLLCLAIVVIAIILLFARHFRRKSDDNVSNTLSY